MSTGFSHTARNYYQLTKPGIIYGNLMVAIACFVFASQGEISWQTLIAMSLGTSLIIACACVCNNIIDTPLDAEMERTNKRSLVRHEISRPAAAAYAFVLGVIGLYILIAYTNWLTVGIGIAGWFFYVVVYTVSKRHTLHSTLIGTISGSTPPVAGYVAVTNQMDVTAMLLFFLLVTWQMPHFYAIAIRRIDDYKKAHLPVLPIIKGFDATRKQIIAYIVAFAILIIAFSYHAKTGVIFLAIMTIGNLNWLKLALQKTHRSDEARWAKKVFLFSLNILVIFSILIASTAYLPF